MFLGDSLISWKCKKQPTVSRSSAKAEYHALLGLSCELTWLNNLLQEFDVQVGPAMVLSDNQSAIHWASNSFHERSKHIEIDCHFIREKANKGIIKLIHVKRHPQLARCSNQILACSTVSQHYLQVGCS